MESSFLSDDQLHRFDSPTQEQNVFEEEKTLEENLQDEIEVLQRELKSSQNRVFHRIAKIKNAIEKLNPILEYAEQNENVYLQKKIEEIINELI